MCARCARIVPLEFSGGRVMRSQVQVAAAVVGHVVHASRAVCCVLCVLCVLCAHGRQKGREDEHPLLAIIVNVGAARVQQRLEEDKCRARRRDDVVDEVVRRVLEGSGDHRLTVHRVVHLVGARDDARACPTARAQRERARTRGRKQEQTLVLVSTDIASMRIRDRRVVWCLF